MIIRDNITINLPSKWQMQENGDSVSIYNNNGQGAVTISFYTILKNEKPIMEFISEKAVDFIRQSEIKLNKSFIVDMTDNKRVVLSGSGETKDGEFIKIYILANNSRFILITYDSTKKNREVKVVDKIVESINFI